MIHRQTTWGNSQPGEIAIFRRLEVVFKGTGPPMPQLLHIQDDIQYHCP